MQRVTAPRGSKDILYGQPPYGWRLSDDRSKVVKEKDEQRVIGMIRQMYFSLRLPMRGIVDRLAEQGVVNRRGKPFMLSRVFEILRGEKRAARAPKKASRPPEKPKKPARAPAAKRAPAATMRAKKSQKSRRR